MNHPVKMLNTYTLKRTSYSPLQDENWQDTEYNLKLDTYQHKDHNMWDWLKVTVRDHDNKPLISFVHNYHDLPHSIYAKQNGKEFMITSGHYQCISIYNITDNEFKDYAYPNDEELAFGRALCPEVFDWDSKTNTLTITGRKWGGPKEIMIIHNADLNNLVFTNTTWEDAYEGE